MLHAHCMAKPPPKRRTVPFDAYPDECCALMVAYPTRQKRPLYCRRDARCTGLTNQLVQGPDRRFADRYNHTGGEGSRYAPPAMCAL